MKLKRLLKKYSVEIILLPFSICFSIWLMFSTFSYKNGSMLIATKAWSDFASHIPLIRSFSLGSNFPPQYPLFPGEPIKYHFLFYYIVGILEKIGLRIDLALNIPSVLGFLLLIFAIYFFAKKIFRSRSVGILSVIFFLFNSSLSFMYFFQKYPLSTKSLDQIMANTDFVSFAPYGQGIVSAFWNLNIYTNQRHLALSLALSLFIIYLVIKPIFNKKELSLKAHLLLGAVLGLSFFLNTAVFITTCAVVLALSIVFAKIRKKTLLLLITGALIALPQYLYLTSSPGFSPRFNFGYLTTNDFTLFKFLQFWIYNLGLSIILIPLGFSLASRNQKKLLLSFFVLFVIGNTIQFSPEIAANHKFFNYFLIVGNMFSAYALFSLWKRKVLLKPVIVTLFFFMVLGGIIDFFPIYNDSKIGLADYKINADSLWIKNNTNPNSVFMNTTFLYDSASLAGRKIFMGWPYFAWSAGYNTDKRGAVMKDILGSQDKQTICKLSEKNKINYIEIKIQNPPDSNIPTISNIFENEFSKSYVNSSENYSIYSIDKNCTRYD